MTTTEEARLRSCIDELAAALSPVMKRGTSVRFGMVTADNGGSPPTIDVDGRPMRYIDTGTAAPAVGQYVVWFQDEPSAVALAVIGDQFVCPIADPVDKSRQYWWHDSAFTSHAWHVNIGQTILAVSVSDNSDTTGFSARQRTTIQSVDITVAQTPGSSPDATQTEAHGHNVNPTGASTIYIDDVVVTSSGDYFYVAGPTQTGTVTDVYKNGAQLAPVTVSTGGGWGSHLHYDHVNDVVLWAPRGGPTGELYSIDQTSGAETLLISGDTPRTGNGGYTHIDFAPDGSIWCTDLDDGGTNVMRHYSAAGALLGTVTTGGPFTGIPASKVWHIDADGTVFYGDSSSIGFKVSPSDYVERPVLCPYSYATAGIMSQRVPDVSGLFSVAYFTVPGVYPAGDESGNGLETFSGGPPLSSRWKEQPVWRAVLPVLQ